MDISLPFLDRIYLKRKKNERKDEIKRLENEKIKLKQATQKLSAREHVKIVEDEINKINMNIKYIKSKQILDEDDNLPSETYKLDLDSLRKSINEINLENPHIKLNQDPIKSFNPQVKKI